MTLHWNCQTLTWVDTSPVALLAGYTCPCYHLPIGNACETQVPRAAAWDLKTCGHPPHSMILMLVFFLCVPWLDSWRVRTCFCFNLNLSERCWVLHPLIQLLWSSLVCLSNSTRSVGTSFHTNRKPKWKKWSSSTGQRNGMQQYPAWIGKWRAQQVSWSYCKYDFFFIAMSSLSDRFPQYKLTSFAGGLRDRT